MKRFLTIVVCIAAAAACSSHPAASSSRAAAATASPLPAPSTTQPDRAVPVTLVVVTYSGLIGVNVDDINCLFVSRVSSVAVKDATGRLVATGDLSSTKGNVSRLAGRYKCTAILPVTVPEVNTAFLTVTINGHDYPIKTGDLSSFIDLEP